MNIAIRNPFKKADETFGQKVSRIGKDRAAHAVVEVGFGMIGVLATAVGTWAMARNSEKENQNV